MNLSAFLATQRVPMLVNRVKQLEAIQKAIYHPEASCQLVLIRGKGGMGKSRLSEEILWRGGNWRIRQEEQRGPIPTSHPEWDWTQYGPAIVGDLIDMSAAHLHARAPFLRAIRDALVWPGSEVSFTRYDAAYDRFQSQRVYMGDFDYIQQLGREVEAQFLNDYKANAQFGRTTLILDTVEKLYPMGGTELLIKEGLLQAEDMAFYSYQWLLKQIRGGGLPNTTLILVGRAEEGHAFFDAIEEAASHSSDCKITPLEEIGSFSLKDTRVYFQALAEDWREKAKSDTEAEPIAASITNIEKDEDRVETIWIYTNGQPVRLALYTDLIIEDWNIPERLEESPSQARKIQESSDELQKAQGEIEAGFVRLLFGHPSLRAEILKALARAPRGLDVEQLHYSLGSLPGETPQAWLERSKSNFKLHEFEEQIAAELKALQQLAIVKIRPDGRLGLQDEVYRIYTRALSGDERGRQAEQEARQKLYAQLEIWAHYHYENRLESIIKFQTYDERQLRFERPSQALEVRFTTLPKQQIERAQLRTEMQQWELEGLHYALLLDFTHNFNDELFELADQKWVAYDEDADAVIRAELWQLLKDPAYALEEFGNLTEWPNLKKRDESARNAFERIALQNDITDWIKRFDLRKDYKRAIQFSEQVEKAIQKWAKEKAEEANYLPASWNHTLARHERALWKDYACIFTGRDVLTTLHGMEIAAQELEKLLQHSQQEVVFPERNEYGFLGHPAETKVQRVVAIYYNYIGYAYAGQGYSSKAREAYGKALLSMRKTEDIDRQATTRNNLARVLSDRGHARGRRLCLDALELRKQQGAEVPIAYSYNTLALIDNDHARPDLAWIEAAIAVAYFRKAEDPRGLGLALLQLSEALRRLAKRKIESYHLRGDLSEAVLATAERAVDEAVKLFTEGIASKEAIRRGEAWIEKGCLERDLILFGEDKQRHYRDALYYLEQAANLAIDIKHTAIELDARVNMAWTHYHYGRFEQCETVLQESEKLLPNDCWFKEGKALPRSERDDLYVYQQLSKMYGLRGRIALEQFDERVKEVKKTESSKEKRRDQIREDETAQQQLQKAAESYVLALAYAQLLSPRSSMLTVVYDSVYNHIKGFNLSELEDFQVYAEKTHKELRVADIKLADFGNLGEFLVYTFGQIGEGS